MTNSVRLAYLLVQLAAISLGIYAGVELVAWVGR